MNVLPQHVGRDGFVLATALDDGRVSGFASGCTGRFGQVWTDRVAAALGPARAQEVLDGHFELVELAVVPASRGRGSGAALLEAILRDRPEPRALLQTHDVDSAAMRLSLRAGSTRLVPLSWGVVLRKELR